jgi:hypothetical protein
LKREHRLAWLHKVLRGVSFASRIRRPCSAKAFVAYRSAKVRTFPVSGDFTVLRSPAVCHTLAARRISGSQTLIDKTPPATLGYDFLVTLEPRCSNAKDSIREQ